MHFRTTLSIRTKLAIIISLFITAVSLFIYLYFPSRQEESEFRALHDKARSIAEITAYAISPAIVFDDREAAAEVITGVHRNIEVAYVVATTADDSVTAHYKLHNAEKTGYKENPEAAHVSRDETVLHLSTSIVHGERTIGRLYIGVSLLDMNERVSDSRRKIALISLLIFLAGIGVVLSISFRITRSLSEMVASMQQISEGEFSTHVNIASMDEVGQLAHSFNMMVDKLGMARQELEILNQSLELRVSERTAELRNEIQERRRIEEALRMSELQYRQLVQMAPVAIFIHDGEQFTLVNAGAVALLGAKSEREIIGQPIHTVLSSQVSQQLELALEGSDRLHMVETTFFGKDRKPVEVEVAVTVYNTNEKTVHQLIAHDISERKRAREELIEAKERAERSDKLKDYFIANMTHEIRTPLNIIMGYSGYAAQLITDKMEDEEMEIFSAIDRAGKRLMRTVENVLNISRIRTGTFKGRKETIDVVSTVGKLVNDMQSIAREKNLKLEFNSSERSLVTMLDAHALEQALANLIENSLKFTEVGGITVTLDANREHFDVIVEDTGIGISKEYLPHVFDTFSQEDASMTREYQGLGLGLSLTKEYVQLNGGVITVQSTKGSGTTMRMRYRHNAASESKDASQAGI